MKRTSNTLKEMELPRVGPIEQAYQTVEARKQRSMNRRFLENHLKHLKTSFYNHYRRHSVKFEMHK
jgi:hypothetical protein